MHSSVYAENGSCDEIGSFGYGSHASCYVDNGFCNLILADKHNLDALFQIVSIQDLLWPPDAVRSICDIMKLCNQLDTHETCQNDDACQKPGDISAEDNGWISSMFFIPIAQLAAKYPMFSDIVCDLYSYI